MFIGKYKGDLYYSTDGISAERMKDDQKLVLTYAEIKEAQDEEDSSDQTRMKKHRSRYPYRAWTKNWKEVLKLETKLPQTGLSM